MYKLPLGLSIRIGRPLGFYNDKYNYELDPNFENKLKELEKLDAKNLESISSEGFRVLLFAQKIMDKQGTLVIKNVSKEVNDSFEETGFCTILTIV